MSNHLLTFDKLQINSDNWDIVYADQKSAYAFYTPEQGVLLLRTAGKLTPEILNKQVQFINNFGIQVNKKIPNYRTILIWDITDVYHYRALKKIRRKLDFISVDLIFFVSGRPLHFVYFLLYSVFNKNGIHKTFSHYSDALEYSRQIKNLAGNTSSLSGNFLEIWNYQQKTVRIKGSQKRFIELPEWQYKNEHHTLKAQVRFFEPNVIVFRIQGRLSLIDIHTLQQKILHIGNDIGINFNNEAVSLIIDLKKVSLITTEGRKLLGHLEGTSSYPVKYIVLIANQYIRYLFYTRTFLSPNRYRHWKIVSNYSKAFSFIEKPGLLDYSDIKKLQSVHPAKNYSTLKRQFEKLQVTYKQLYKEQMHTKRNVRRILSYVNVGGIIKTPFQPRYDDFTLEGEVYNTFALLQQDLQKVRPGNFSNDADIGFSHSNIQRIISNISDPVLVYHHKIILMVNERLAELLGYQVHEIENQPFSAILSPFEVHRIERYLDIINVHNEVSCEMINSFGVSIKVRFSMENILLDGMAAQLIFIHPIVHSQSATSTKPKPKTASPSLDHKILRNKALAGILVFHNAMLQNIQKQRVHSIEVINDVTSWHSFQSLFWMSHFLKKHYEEALLFDMQQKNTQFLSPKEVLKEVYTVISDYLAYAKPNLQLITSESQFEQKVKLSADHYLINALIIRILHLFADGTKAHQLELGSRDLPGHKIEFYVKDKGAPINFYTLALGNNHTIPVLALADMETLLKHYNAEFFIRQTQEAGNCVSMIFPVYQRSLRSNGINLNLEKHQIIIFDNQKGFDTIKTALYNTGASTKHAQNAFDLLKMVAEEFVSLVIINLNEKGIDDIELIKNVKHTNDNTVVVGMTQNQPPKKIKQYKEITEADALISKPINITELYTVIHNALV